MDYIDNSNDRGKLEKLKKKINETHFLEWMVGNIKTRPLSHDIILKHIEEQRKLLGDNDEFIYFYTRVIGMIQYVPSSSIMKSLRRKAISLYKELKKKSDKRFYLVVQCNPHTRLNPTSFFLGQKSNLFMSIMFLCVYPKLREHFVDFVCMNKNTIPFALHGKFDEEIRTHVFVDDTSLTGKQAVENLSCPSNISSYLKKLDINLYFLVLFISEHAENKILDFNGENMYNMYTEIRLLKSSSDIVPRKIRLQDLQNVMSKFEPRHRSEYYDAFFERDIDDDEDDDSDEEMKWDERITKYLNLLGLGDGKFLFYSDLKIPDHVSIDPLFLINPPLIKKSSSGKLIKLIRRNPPFVSNIRQPSTTEHDGRVLNGGFASIVYKTDEWKEWIN